MSEVNDVFSEMKRFVGFNDGDIENLIRLRDVFQKHGPTITNGFYDTLAQYPITNKLIEGRIDALKATHARWMAELFQGTYDGAYLESRHRIGMAHVRINLPPYYVEGVMNYIRSRGLEAIMSEMHDEASVGSHYSSLLKILDLDLMIINIAYGDERLDRLSAFTGMKRTLLENCIKQGKRK